MLLTVNPDNPQERTLHQVAEGIRRGGLYILPTDTVFAFVCSLAHKSALEKIYRLKEMPKNKPLALYCRDFSQASEYVRLENNSIFRWMKSNLPGPFTLILRAGKSLPQYTLTKQKTVGIRIVDHPVIQGILSKLDSPLVGSSVFLHDHYVTYAEDLEKQFGKLVDGIIDNGPLEPSMSTVLDATEYPMQLVRQGKGIYSE